MVMINLISVAVLGFVILMLAEYFSRRWRYFWKVRRTNDRMIPKFSGEPQRINDARNLKIG